MPVNKSVEAFTCRGLNCAQAVLKGFEDIKGVDQGLIRKARAYGGGRAEEGRCGALHGALMMVEDADEAEQIKIQFKEEAGAESCRELKTVHKTPCTKCVEIAARILAEKTTEQV